MNYPFTNRNYGILTNFGTHMAYSEKNENGKLSDLSACVSVS